MAEKYFDSRSNSEAQAFKSPAPYAPYELIFDFTPLFQQAELGSVVGKFSSGGKSRRNVVIKNMLLIIENRKNRQIEQKQNPEFPYKTRLWRSHRCINSSIYQSDHLSFTGHTLTKLLHILAGSIGLIDRFGVIMP